MSRDEEHRKMVCGTRSYVMANAQAPTPSFSAFEQELAHCHHPALAPHSFVFSQFGSGNGQPQGASRVLGQRLYYTTRDLVYYSYDYEPPPALPRRPPPRLHPTTTTSPLLSCSGNRPNILLPSSHGLDKMLDPQTPQGGLCQADRFSHIKPHIAILAVSSCSTHGSPFIHCLVGHTLTIQSLIATSQRL